MENFLGHFFITFCSSLLGCIITLKIIKLKDKNKEKKTKLFVYSFYEEFIKAYNEYLEINEHIIVCNKLRGEPTCFNYRIPFGLINKRNANYKTIFFLQEKIDKSGLSARIVPCPTEEEMERYIEGKEKYIPYAIEVTI